VYVRDILSPSSWLISDPNKRSKQSKLLFNPEDGVIACHISEDTRPLFAVISMRNLALAEHRNLVHV
jgi:hypothetical protein